MYSVNNMTTKLFKLFSKYKYLLLVVAVGIIFMLWQPGGGNDNKPPAATTAEYSVSEAEQRLAEAISQIQGVGKTEVVLSLKTDIEIVLQEDVRQQVQTDSTGNSKTDEQYETVMISSSGSQQPIVTKRIFPEFQGALIVCEGGGSPSIQLAITEAVSALTGLGSNKITIAKMKE